MNEGAARSAGGPRTVFVDGHVHVYPEVPLEALFGAVERNAKHAAVRTEAAAGPQCVLVLADPAGVDGFGRLSRLASAHAHGGHCLPSWTAASLDGEHAAFRHDDGLAVVFLRGQQLVTREGLEVLAVNAADTVANGHDLRRTLDDVRARGGWSQIAWGVGKWLGRRGRLVSDAVRAEAGSGDVVLGDNGGRPALWRFVPQFDLAIAQGMPILAGSDPLRVQGDEGRIASYGFDVALPALRGEAFADALKAAIGDRGIPLRTRGRRVGAHTFVLNQLRLRLPSRARAPTR